MLDIQVISAMNETTVCQVDERLWECTRFDMKSRKSLKGEQKYYLADLSFYLALKTDNRINYGPVFESIVYGYARSLGYEVSVGRIGKLECAFVMRSHEMEYAYVQVAMTIMGDRGPRVPPARADSGQLAEVRHHAQ